jgi:hypothetical protein
MVGHIKKITKFARSKERELSERRPWRGYYWICNKSRILTYGTNP